MAKKNSTAKDTDCHSRFLGKWQRYLEVKLFISLSAWYW